MPDVKVALGEFEEDLQRVQTALESKRQAKNLNADGEHVIRETFDTFRSMASVLRDPTFPLERRREVLRRVLQKRDGMRPIADDIDPKGPPGWRKALKKVVVRHLAEPALVGAGAAAEEVWE